MWSHDAEEDAKAKVCMKCLPCERDSQREKGGREQFAHIEIPVTARVLRGFVWCPLANP